MRRLLRLCSAIFTVTFFPRGGSDTNRYYFRVPVNLVRLGDVRIQDCRTFARPVVPHFANLMR
jgi:hypothetical protein